MAAECFLDDTFERNLHRWTKSSSFMHPLNRLAPIFQSFGQQAAKFIHKNMGVKPIRPEGKEECWITPSLYWISRHINQNHSIKASNTNLQGAIAKWRECTKKMQEDLERSVWRSGSHKIRSSSTKSSMKISSSTNSRQDSPLSNSSWLEIEMKIRKAKFLELELPFLQTVKIHNSRAVDYQIYWCINCCSKYDNTVSS